MRSSPGRHGIALFFDLECSVALAKPSGAVQFKRIGAEKGDSRSKQRLGGLHHRYDLAA
jgi:hypothetical protein